MHSSFKTLKTEGRGEIIEKHSRFISSTSPASSEKEALEFINRIRSKYQDASHNVYVYSVHEGETGYCRYSDDGEPSGTAGLPILDVIKQEGLADLAIVVTRYFGGTLLGKGGLVRAYSRCASAGILAAGIIQKVLCRSISLDFDYVFLGKIQAFVSSKSFKVDATEFKDKISMNIWVPADEVCSFTHQIGEITSAKAIITLGNIKYIVMEEQ